MNADDKIDMTSAVVSSRSDHVTHPKYRPDIDGLRAVAVFSVISFHAFPNWIEGGFIGVDIFFVISGFLISTIIFNSLQNGSFSFTDFYIRRIRRIFPALLTVLIFCLAFGWVALLADEYKLLGKHVLGGAGFASNFILWNESGYFDTRAETKPLLHLWSLGIEEQFYIAWPMLLWLAWRSRFNVLAVIGGLALVSFALNLYQQTNNPVADFYSPQTRFWELLAGSTLAYAALHYHRVLAIPHSHLLRYMQSTIGALLIAAGILVISKDQPFPSYWALLPAAGTVIIITAGKDAWFNRCLLSNRLMVWFGLISYPLYLWHWPLLSFARIVEGETPAPSIRIAAVFAAVVLAWGTYKLVEKPLRFSGRARLVAGVLAATMIAIASTGWQIYALGGLSFRNVVALNSIVSSGFDGGARGLAKNGCGIEDAAELELIARCLSDNREQPSLALIGDSKADALFNGLVRTSTENTRWLFAGGTKGSAVLVPALSDKLYARSQKIARIALKAVVQNPNIDTVLLATATRELFYLKNNYSIEDLPASPHYEAALEGLSAFVGELVKSGKKVILLVDNPTLPDPKSCIVRKTSLPLIDHILSVKENPSCTISIERHRQLSQKYRALLDAVMTKYPDSVSIFDTLPILCESATHACTYQRNGRLLYEYSDHISDYAAGLIGEKINNLLRERDKPIVQRGLL